MFNNLRLIFLGSTNKIADMTEGIAVIGKDVNSEANNINQYDENHMVTEDGDKDLTSANDVAMKVCTA